MRATSPAFLALALVGACTSASSATRRPDTSVDMTLAEQRLAAANGAYFEFQVEHPVQPAAGSCAPKYPPVQQPFSFDIA